MVGLGAGEIALGMLLALYNLLYCAPLIGLVATRMLLSPERSELLFGRLRAGVDWAFAKLLPPLLGVGGAALLIDGIRRLLNASTVS